MSMTEVHRFSRSTREYLLLKHDARGCLTPRVEVFILYVFLRIGATAPRPECMGTRDA